MASSDESDLDRLAEALSKRGRVRTPRPIAEILSQLMSRRGYATVLTAVEWSDVWRQVAGIHAAHTRPGKFSRGVLEVIVRHSALIQELTFEKKRLLAGITARAPQFKVKDLRFRVGDIT